MFGLFKRRATLVKYPEPMSAEDISRIFSEYGDNSKIWQAIDTVIDSHLLSAVNDSSDPKLDSHGRSHACGRVDAVSTLKSKMEEYRKWKTGKTNYKSS
jgi:hypothetical protein